MRHRAARQNRQYAAIPNVAMRDDQVSIEARGMLALLMTYSDDWIFQRDHLMQMAGVGRDKFQRIMRELNDAGYVMRVPLRDEGGLVQGSTWLICDVPGRPPENPVVGATEGLKNRQPEKPTAGFSGPIRRPRDKKTKREENQRACAREERDRFEDFVEAHPRVPNRALAEKAWVRAIERGADAGELVAAAKAYRDEKRGTSTQYVAKAENWLADERWREVRGETREPSTAAKAPVDLAAFWAEKIRSDRYVPPSAVSAGVAREILARGLVSRDQLRNAGIPSFDPDVPDRTARSSSLNGQEARDV
jgi:hypothetical protein